MKILTFADLHLRGTVPSCVNHSVTEWVDIQRKALNKVADIAIENKVDAVHLGGDIFHSESSATFEVINLFFEFVIRLHNAGIRVYVIAGNHDLPGHSSSNIGKSAVGIVFNNPLICDMSSALSYVKGCNFDIDDYGKSEFIFKHVLCMPEEKKPDFVECDTPQTLLDKYPNAKIIFTGDYHRNFVYKKNGRMVINSGCLTKQASDFEDYETGVYLTDLDTLEVEWCPIDIPQEFVKNGKEKDKKSDESIDDFINGINRSSVTLDFIGELRKESEKLEDNIKNKINEWIEEIG